MNIITLLATSLCLILFGCAVGPDFHSPAAPATKRYTESSLPKKTVSTSGVAGSAQHFFSGQDIPGEWWTLFHSPQLNELICRGLAKSPNLKAAQAALRQAEENLNVQIGTLLFPSVNAQFSGSRQRFSPSLFGSPSSQTNVFNLYNASVNVSYVLDIFGGSRREIEAYRAQVDYQRFQLEAAYLTLTANIVTTAVTEASLHAQIRATRELIQLEKKQLAIMEKQFYLGGVSRADILTQQTQLAQLHALLPPLENGLAQTRHALAVLVGSLPSESKLPVFNLENLHLPTKLPVSLPSCLVQQRPDIRAAEALLHQASAQVGVATANLLPQVTLSGLFSSQALAPAQLFTADSAVWNYGAQILQPVFRGGALRAAKRSAIAGYEQAAAQYRQTVLHAFQNVADALRVIEYDAKTLQAQTHAESSAKATLVLTQKQYQLGAVNYLQVLAADRQYQQTYIDRVKAQAARFADTAALFQALGGGWWNR